MLRVRVLRRWRVQRVAGAGIDVGRHRGRREGRDNGAAFFVDAATTSA